MKLSTLNKVSFEDYHFLIDFETDSSAVYSIGHRSNESRGSYLMVGTIHIHFRDDPPLIFIQLTLNQEDADDDAFMHLLSGINGVIDPNSVYPYRWEYLLELPEQRRFESKLQTEQFDSRGFLL